MQRASRRSDLTGKKRSTKPWLNGMPRLIFVSDMSDAISEEVEFPYLEEETIQNVASDRGRRHRWLWLTKRPQRMAAFSNWLSCDWPSNLWVATSITTQKSISRVKHLLRVGDDTTTRLLSVEPQWEAIDLERWLPQIDWVLQGGESGPKAHEFPIFGSLVKENQTTSGMNQRFITWRCPTALRAGLTTETGQSL